MKTLALSLIAVAFVPLLATAAPSNDSSATRKPAASVAGQPGDSAKATRTVDVTMNDTMRFSPNAIPVKAGDTIRFQVRNAGMIEHEMVIGTTAELKEHAKMMREMAGEKHAAPNKLTLAPGAQGTLVWRFEKPGTVDFACLVPGHFEAGMVGKVVVRK
jgi:uncharacterized cupredoxin-like copper-binding protein